MWSREHNIVRKGWMLTGVYCALTIVPGVSGMIGFIVGFGVMMIAVPSAMLIDMAFAQFGPVSNTVKAAIFIALVVLLVPVPTFIQAWRTATPGQRLIAIAQIAVMWLLAAAASFYAMHSFNMSWPY